MTEVKKNLSGTWGFASLLLSLVGFSMLFLVAADRDGSTESTSPWLIGAAILSGFLFLLGAIGVLFRLSGVDSESPTIARTAVGGPAAQALLERWLRRSRYYRLIGGILGFVAGIPLATGGTSGTVFVTLVGITIGGALAEIHVLSRRRPNTAVADLTVRSLRDYVNRTDVAAMAAVAMGAVVVNIARLLGYGIDNSGRWAVVALAVLVAVVGLQHLVATRSRPALSAELRQADDLLRFLAATQGFARPAIALSFFMLAVAVADAASNLALRTIAVALVLLGLVWWYRGRHGRIPGLAKQALAS